MPALADGARFGRYLVERPLGEGGMGRVYIASDTVLRRKVALKVMSTEHDEARIGLMLREARAAAALHHPNAVAVWDAGEIDGVPYIAMELVHGVSLRARMLEADLSVDRKIHWVLQIARALDAAHRVGIVHRDVKPENVIVCEDDTVKVLDFGIAKNVESPDEPPPSSGPDGVPTSFRTAEGKIPGTPKYMSPEQIGGARVDARTDQYAWGLVAYELLSGRSSHWTGPFGDPPPLLTTRDPSLPFELAVCVATALARKPELRHASMTTVIGFLEPLLRRFEPSQPTTENPSLRSSGSVRASIRDTTTHPPKPMGTNRTRADAPAELRSLRARRRWTIASVIAIVTGSLFLWLEVRSRGSHVGLAPTTSASPSSSLAVASSNKTESAASIESATASDDDASSAAPAPNQHPTTATTTFAPKPKHCVCFTGELALCAPNKLRPSTSCQCMSMGKGSLCSQPTTGPCRDLVAYSGMFLGQTCLGYTRDGQVANGTTTQCRNACDGRERNDLPAGAACDGFNSFGEKRPGVVRCE